MIRYIDAHAHLGTPEEQMIREQNGILSLICATNPVEAQEVERVCLKSAMLHPTYGLHPWHTGRYAVSDMLPYLEKTSIVGEIGMDSVWCDIPLCVQEDAFIAQLDFAESCKKPVILHTKGQERRIADIMERYTMPALVHWYSSSDDLDRYIARDAYFTLGPDLSVNPAVQQVAQKAPIDRILLETDGFSAVQWAMGNDLALARIPDVLCDLETQFASIREMSLVETHALLAENFSRFTGISR